MKPNMSTNPFNAAGHFWASQNGISIILLETLLHGCYSICKVGALHTWKEYSLESKKPSKQTVFSLWSLICMHKA